MSITDYLSFQFNITEFLIVVLISIIVTLLFDLPMMEVKSILLDKDLSEESEGMEEEPFTINSKN